MKRRAVCQVLGFALVPLLSALAPLVAIPVIARSHGADGWGAIAVGIALGNACAVTADLGWTVVGPQRIARQLSDRRSLHEASLVSRGAALAVLLPIVAAGAWWCARAMPGAAIATTIGIGLTALSPAWLFTGTGQPWALLAVEAVPKVIAGASATIAIGAGAPLEVYGVALGLAACTTTFTAARRDRLRLGRTALRSVPTTIRALWVISVGRAVSTTSTVMPTIIVGAVAAPLVPVFAALDRPVRMGLQILAAVPARMQSWLGTDDLSIRRARVRSAVAVNCVLGLVAGLVVLLFVPVVIPILFAGTVTPPRSAVVCTAVLVLVICTSRGLGLAVVAHDRSAATTWTACVIAVVGAVGVTLGTVVAGITGAIAGLVAAETAGLVPQLAALARDRSRT